MPGDTQGFIRLETLFHSALGIPQEKRAEFVHNACADHPSLALELLNLLDAEIQVSRLVHDSGPSSASCAQATDPWIGEKIGPFEIIRHLGQGGMGVVYLGKRTGSFEQTVAIKLVSGSLRRNDLQQHFLRERDTLAALQHRNIVDLVDGGVTPNGVPWLAMEYIEGQRIDVICDDPKIGVNDILSLMLQLCEAVGYVHRNLLLHRDLKPSNVLITPEGILKLVDFGAFKSLAARRDSAPQSEIRALTVRYASPEHLQGEEMSVATDIFSLGMMLCRLLLGRLPQTLDGLSGSDYLDALKAEPYANIAQQLHRRFSTAQLAKDLQAIIQKALHFNAALRYQSADALAADLQAAAQGNIISAIPSRQSDHLVRFLKRNLTAAMLSFCIVVLIAIGVGLMLRANFRIRAEQLRAERGLNDETGLMHFLLANYFDQLKEIPGSTSAQKQAVSQTISFVDNLATIADRPDMQAERVRAYTEMGSLLGNPYENNLGDTKGAIQTLDKAVELGRKLVSANQANSTFHQLDADANLALGRVYFANGNPHQAATYLLSAVNESQNVIRAGHHYAATLAEAASVTDSLGDVNALEGAVTLHDPVEAARRYAEAQSLDVEGLAADPQCSRCRRGVALEYWKLGMLENNATNAAHLYEKGIATLNVFPQQEFESARVQRILKVTQQKLGIAYLQIGRTADGLRILNSTRVDLQKAVALDPTDSRSHFDLFGLNFNISEFTDVFGKRGFASAIDEELLREAQTMVKLDPENTQWRALEAGAELRLGRLYLHDGNLHRGNELTQSAARKLLELTQQGTSEPDLLQNTADALCETQGDALLAVSNATQSIQHTLFPSSGQYLTLVRAELLAGNMAAAKQAAQKVLSTATDQREPLQVNQAAQARAVLNADSTSTARKAMGSLLARAHWQLAN